MKKFFNKEERKKAERRSKIVTQANLNESRDKVLTKGKKFRYPFQYSKYRLVVNTIAIGVTATAACLAIGWMQLFRFNNTGEMLYRFTRVIPLTVAEVDGHGVRFSDYLMLYRSSVASIEQQQGEFDRSEESRGQLKAFQERALKLAEESTYALARLEEMGQPVTDEEVEAVVSRHRMVAGELSSEESFAGIVKNNFGLNLKEYRRMVRLSLAKKKYSENADEKVKQLTAELQATLDENKGDLEGAAQKFRQNDLVSYEVVKNPVGLDNLDGGRAEKAGTLAEGQLSEPFTAVNGEGVYIVKLLKKTDKGVSYESVWLRFSVLNEEMAELEKTGKIQEKIQL